MIIGSGGKPYWCLSLACCCDITLAEYVGPICPIVRYNIVAVAIDNAITRIGITTGTRLVCGFSSPSIVTIYWIVCKRVIKEPCNQLQSFENICKEDFTS